MAIQVSGTEVISNSRALNNIASVDATTAAAIAAGGVGGGYWTNIAEVTLGVSSVSAIDITLPTGYDVHKIDIVLPRPSSGVLKTLFQLRNSGGTAQNFAYGVQNLALTNHEANHSTNATDMEITALYGNNAADFNFQSIEILDANSSSIKTKWHMAGHNFGASYWNYFFADLGGGGQLSAATTSSARFYYSGTNFGTATGLYYRIYGHAY